jgi:hypothetical protein
MKLAAQLRSDIDDLVERLSVEMASVVIGIAVAEMHAGRRIEARIGAVAHRQRRDLHPDVSITDQDRSVRNLAVRKLRLDKDRPSGLCARSEA